MADRIMEKMKKDSCEVCGWSPPQLFPNISRKILHAHHVILRCRGGETEEENLVTLCPNHHAIAHVLTGGAKVSAYGLLPGVITKAALLKAIREIDADPGKWLATRGDEVNQKVGKLIPKNLNRELRKNGDALHICNTCQELVNVVVNRTGECLRCRRHRLKATREQRGGAQKVKIEADGSPLSR